MKARKRDLIGRRIVAVDSRRYYDAGRREWITDPILTLDNGRRVWIVTAETDGSEYGHDICISDPLKRKARDV